MNPEKPNSAPESDTLFQRYSHDKFLSTKHTDIETPAQPSSKILRATATRKLDQKLRKILND